MYYRYNNEIIDNSEDGSDKKNISNLHWTLIILAIILLIAIGMVVYHFTKKENIKISSIRKTLRK
jgi:choline-glycine betaine transporter